MAQMFRILGKRGRITIPFEIRQRVGFSYNDVLSFTEAPDGRAVIVKREKICDNCAAEKPQRKEAEDTITLFDFLNSLSGEQQKAAFAHLKLKWDALYYSVVKEQRGTFLPFLICIGTKIGFCTPSQINFHGFFQLCQNPNLPLMDGVSENACPLCVFSFGHAVEE